jgi:hypothetical protein
VEHLVVFRAELPPESPHLELDPRGLVAGFISGQSIATASGATQDGAGHGRVRTAAPSTVLSAFGGLPMGRQGLEYRATIRADQSEDRV